MAVRSFLKKAVGQVVGQAMLATREMIEGGIVTGDETPAEQRLVEVKPVRLTLPHLRPEFDGYRIVQISDIHMDPELTVEHLLAVVDSINAQQPDLVAITGDFVTNNAHLYADGLIAALSELTPVDGTVGVMGNHDHRPWSDPDVIRFVMSESGMINLNNEVYSLQRGEALLHIAGVDDVLRGQADLDRVLERMPPRGAAILLCHVPDFVETTAQTGRFDLQISGHSHGGQVALPFVGARIFPRYGRKYPAGCYHVNGMIQYTNRGLGVGPPRIRFNCRPEITVFTLNAGLHHHVDHYDVMLSGVAYHPEG